MINITNHFKEDCLSHSQVYDAISSPTHTSPDPHILPPEHLSGSTNDDILVNIQVAS